MIRPKKLLDFINELESSSDKDYRFWGVDCWPVLRNTVLLLVTHGVVVRSIRPPVSEMLKAFWHMFLLLLKGRACHSFFLTDYKYLSESAGKRFFRDSSVIAEAVRAKGQNARIFTQGICDYRKDAVDSVFPIILVAHLLSGILSKFGGARRLAIYVNDCLTMLRDCGTPVDQLPNNNKLIKNVWFVVIASQLLAFLLKRLKPQRCYVVCYYSLIGMSLCVACKKLGIEIVDLQHGVSGKNMRAYGRWRNVPADGYCSLPSTFYCWTKNDAAAINEWVEEFSCPYHSALVVGNIWKEFLKGSREALDTGGVWNNSIEEVAISYDRVNVITLSSCLLPSNMHSYIKENSRELFLVRVHPNFRESDFTQLEAEFKKLGDNIVVEAATKCPIKHLMSCADMHFTEWSASFYDAYFEGVPTVILSPVGEDYFENFISDGYAISVTASEQLRLGVRNLNKFKPEIIPEEVWRERLL